MAYTLDQIDRKILQTEKVLEFWKRAREVVSNPLFAELSSTPLDVPSSDGKLLPRLPPESNGAAPSQSYGDLKRLTLECLPDISPGFTPQDMVKRIEAAGYVFRTKTPAISVNDTLQTLKKEKRAHVSRKSNSNANLWVRGPAIEKEVPSEEKTS